MLDFTINSDKDLEEMFAKLNDEENNFHSSVEITFKNDSLLSDDTLAKLSKTNFIKSWPCELEILRPKGLTLKQKEIVLNHDSIASKLNIESFRDFISSSEKLADIALKSKLLHSKLDTLEIKDNCQTFENSCAARSIMHVLRDFNLLDEKTCTRSKELEIYKNIWISPKGYAHPQKILNFLMNSGIDVMSLEILKRKEETLKNSPELNEIFKLFPQPSFFDKFLKKKPPIPKMEFSDVEEKVENMSLQTLLLVTLVDHVPHIILGKKMKNGKFQVSDTATGEVTTYDTFRKFYESEVGFTGVALQLNLTDHRKNALVADEKSKRTL